jgi:RNA recognition motif-containing protein
MNEEILMNEDDDNVYVFVTNFSRRLRDDDLKWLFDECGIVEEFDIWVDHQDSSTRFAIVEMSPDDAKKAIKKLDGKKVKGRFLWVEKAPKVLGMLPDVCHRVFKRPNSIRPFKSFEDS